MCSPCASKSLWLRLEPAEPSDRRILFRHILPNLLNTIVIMATLDVPSVILIEAALSFLSIGVAPGTASWGADDLRGVATS